MVRAAHPRWSRGRAQQDRCSSLARAWAHCAPSAEHEVPGQVTSPLLSFTTALQKAEKGSFERSAPVEAARVAAGGAGLQEQPPSLSRARQPGPTCVHRETSTAAYYSTAKSKPRGARQRAARVPPHIELAQTRTITPPVPA